MEDLPIVYHYKNNQNLYKHINDLINSNQCVMTQEVIIQSKDCDFYAYRPHR